MHQTNSRFSKLQEKISHKDKVKWISHINLIWLQLVEVTAIILVSVKATLLRIVDIEIPLYDSLDIFYNSNHITTVTSEHIFLSIKLERDKLLSVKDPNTVLIFLYTNFELSRKTGRGQLGFLCAFLLFFFYFCLFWTGNRKECHNFPWILTFYRWEKMAIF